MGEFPGVVGLVGGERSWFRPGWRHGRIRYPGGRLEAEYTRDSIGLHLREEGDEVEGEGTAELPGRHDPDRFRKPKR
jgi:hypothetical protein